MPLGGCGVFKPRGVRQKVSWLGEYAQKIDPYSELFMRLIQSYIHLQKLRKISNILQMIARLTSKTRNFSALT